MADVTALVDKAHALGDADKIALVGTILERQNVLQLAGLLSGLEARFDVQVPRPMGGGTAVVKKKEETAPTTFDVILKSGGANKIAVIKAVRAATEMGLREAKELVDKGGQPVKKGLPKEEAEKLAKELKDAGAEVEVKGS